MSTERARAGTWGGSAPDGSSECSGVGAHFVPALVTVHGNGKPGEVFNRNTVFLSQDHARRHHSTCFVYNGLTPMVCSWALVVQTDPLFVFIQNFLESKKTSCGARNSACTFGRSSSLGRRRRAALVGTRETRNVRCAWISVAGVGGAN